MCGCLCTTNKIGNAAVLRGYPDILKMEIEVCEKSMLIMACCDTDIRYEHLMPKLPFEILCSLKSA